MDKVIAVIPARSGSRRVLHKNIRPLAGKPLIVYSIEQALAANRVDRVIVSTDSDVYQQIAEQAGAEVPFLRPEPISEDVDTGLVLKHVVDWLKENEEYEPDMVVLLQPTSPFRVPSDINSAIEILRRDPEAHAVVGVTTVTQHPAWIFRIVSNKKNIFSPRLVSYLGFPMRNLSGLIAQDLPKLYVPNGVIYVTRTEWILQGRIYGDENIPYTMPAERSLDIEEEIDFRIAEILMEEQANRLHELENINNDIQSEPLDKGI